MRGRELKYNRASRAETGRVRPHARAGVEMKLSSIRSLRLIVRPHARAGVEIHAIISDGGESMFALMRGRELKFLTARETAAATAFALMRGRELK